MVYEQGYPPPLGAPAAPSGAPAPAPSSAPPAAPVPAAFAQPAALGAPVAPTPGMPPAAPVPGFFQPAPAYAGTMPPPAAPYPAPGFLPVLECRALSKSYGGAPALNQVTLAVPRGRVVGLLGPNGSGKTTLIKLAAGLLRPTAGEVLVEGACPGPATKARVSYLPERTYFSQGMKVTDCLAYFEDFYADFDRALACDMLSRLAVPLTAHMGALSKGTKEKVQLVLVMARRAALYLLDEPIGGVDPATRDYILDTIISNYRREATILLSTHLIADVERVLDDFVFLHYGTMVMHAPAAFVRQQYGMGLDDYFRGAFRC